MTSALLVRTASSLEDEVASSITFTLQAHADSPLPLDIWYASGT